MPRLERALLTLRARRPGCELNAETPRFLPAGTRPPAVTMTRLERGGKITVQDVLSQMPQRPGATMPPTIRPAHLRASCGSARFSRTTGDLAFASVLGALRESADYFAQVATAEQAAAMQDTTVSGLTGRGAMWAGSEEDVAFQ